MNGNNLKFILKVTALAGFLGSFAPVASAQSFQGIARSTTDLLGLVLPILFIGATIVFLAGVVFYITAGGNEEKIAEGRKYIIWGLIGLFVMVAIWGIVDLFVNFFFPGGLPNAPRLPGLPGISSPNNNTSPSSPFAPSGGVSGDQALCQQAGWVWQNGRCVQPITSNPDFNPYDCVANPTAPGC